MATPISKDSSIYYVLKISWKINISYLLIRKRTCVYQGGRNISFSEHFAYVLNRWSKEIKQISTHLWREFQGSFFSECLLLLNSMCNVPRSICCKILKVRLTILGRYVLKGCGILYKYEINPVVPKSPFLYPLKTSEKRKFLTFSVGRERVHWERMG